MALKVKAIFFKKEPHITRAKVPLKVNHTRDHLKETEPLLEVCDFCHIICMVIYHRIVVNVRHCTTLQQARSQFDTRQQLLIDQLENTLFAPNVCSWCLQGACTHATCYPPEDPDFYAEVTHFFQESLLPFVQNAKLCLPVDNSVPLMPQHFAFEGTDWGHHTAYEELAESQEYFD
jgi:hypothetical protein